jgi:acetate---CoA ligase (ADP-forming)
MRIDPTPLLRPRSIAVLGASDRPGSYGDIVLGNLERSGFEGPVWGINPKRESVHGRTCVPRVADLPEPVDALVVAVPAAAVPAALEDAVELGCGGAVVISAGFGEVDTGRELQERIREIALAAALPLCGPNGNGVCALHGGATMWGDSVDRMRPGGVAMITQSGNVGVNALGSLRGIDFHTLVSTGNQAVLGASDWLLALTASDGVRSVAMFLEDEGDGEELAGALAACAERRVGVAVLKVGSSEAGARAAAAHTGSLAGDARVFRALVEEAGGAWAESPHELLELARVLGEPRARPDVRGGLAVLTCSGGDSGIAADAAHRWGINLPPLAASTRERLEPLLPEAATIDNPLDYTAMVWGNVEVLRRMIAIVGEDRSIAQVMLFYDHPNGPLDPSWEDVRAGIIAGAERSSAAVLVASTLPDLIDTGAVRELARRGVPTIAGLDTAIRCAAALRRPEGEPARLREIAAAAGSVTSRASGEWLDEVEAKRLLSEAGVAVPEGRVVADAAEAVAAAHELRYPVAVKLAAPGLLHKSDAGALELGIADDEQLGAAVERLAALPGAERGRLLVERMGPDGAELVIAARADGVVPSLVVGLGGIWAEALDDVAVLPLPADAARVERAIRSLRGAAVLTGGRGRDPLGIPAAARLGARVGELLIRERLVLVELNPVRVDAAGAIALDAVIGRRGPAPAPARPAGDGGVEPATVG